MSVVVGGRLRAGVDIGDPSEPDFCRLPDAATLFERRAARFAALAVDHPAADYLRFLGTLATAQHAAVRAGSGLAPPTALHLARCREHAMPPLRHLPPQAEASWRPTLDTVLAGMVAAGLPATARSALDGVAAAADERLGALASTVLEDAVAPEEMGQALFVHAALQVELTKLASLLDPRALVPVGEGACPACGAPPIAGMVVGWPKAQGSRYLACSLCATCWSYVRVKCSGCGSTKGIAYHGIEGQGEALKGETCEACRGYLKLFQAQKDPKVDPVADDVASLGLDLMLQAAGWHRLGRNLLLAGS